MCMVGLTVVVIESAVTALYICYAMNPSLINQWDPGFYKEISEVLHQRLQHLSGHTVSTHTMVLLPPEHSYS